MKKFFLLFIFLLPAIVFAQDNSGHIPAGSNYIVTINPSAHIGNGDFSALGKLEMFTHSGETDENGNSLFFGDDDLDADRKAAFDGFFTTIFAQPSKAGIDTTKKFFIFFNSPDSVHYWAYVLPLSNADVFGDFMLSSLFSEKPAVDKGSGFSMVNAERLSVGWTGSYAIILLADYDFYIDETGKNPVEQQHIRDSIMLANMYGIGNSSTDSVISDSLRAQRTARLQKEEKEMLEKLAKDTTPEENVEVRYSYDSYYNPGDYDVPEVDKDSLVRKAARNEMKRLINLPYDLSVCSVANFRNVQQEDFDAMYWYNYGDVMQKRYEEQMSLRRDYYYYTNIGPDTSNIQNMWKGSYIASIVKISGNVATMEHRAYFSPALQANTKGMYTGRVKRKMFRYVKGENMLGFTAMSVDMEKFMKFYGSVYRESMSNSFAGMYQSYYLMVWDLLRVFLDDKTMYNLFDGKFLFAVTDLKPFTSSYVTYEYDENFNQQEVRKEKTEIRPEFVFIAGLGKEKKAKQILAILEKANAVKKQNPMYYLINTPGEYDIKMYLAIRNGMLIITNNEDLIQNHLKHGYSRKERVKGKIRRTGRRSPIVGWWDGKKSFALIKKNEEGNLSDDDLKSLDLLEKNISTGLIIGRRPKNGVQRIDVKVEMNSDDGKSGQTNFVRFFRMINSLFLIHSQTGSQ
ncbi:MAG TPA: hypothetical protein VFU15_13545 [Bacteroidia bacterium]|nr:hypothetical protein [Bacteroidia bacterium]